MAKGFLDGYKTYNTAAGFGSPKAWQKAFKQRMGKEEAEAILQGQQQTPYGILGIEQGATSAAIKKAYRKMMMLWHPDKNPDRISEAEEMSKKIIAAYSILTHS
ncbi:J domain-containing protein [Pedobacter sp. ISL-68]|uniref:J domain-containing protein n=1 Tax=unclassified Pedobacter TaxID=2628915 RepID=UPI001BEAE9BA|nr:MULTISPECIES: J domain-containing protein [unclassified Pedobacter]MBT2561326.1 J domain-containing protein [Pedobacter sp. ISL-64]MBT2590715.1 J domain-containing protein [Pedobacter sp. ISL-68]